MFNTRAVTLFIVAAIQLHRCSEAQELRMRSLQMKQVIELNRNEDSTTHSVRSLILARSPMGLATSPNQWVVVFANGEFAIGNGVDNEAQILRLVYEFGPEKKFDDWNIGAIDSISISPSGRTVCFLEDSGRFAVVQIDGAPVATDCWLPLLMDDCEGVCRGLEIASTAWLDAPERLAVSYVDGRVLVFDPSTRTCELIFSGKCETIRSETDAWKSYLPKSIQERIIGGVEWGVVKMQIGSSFTRKLLTFGAERHAIANFRGAVEVRKTTDDSILFSSAWSDAVRIDANRIALFTFTSSQQPLQCQIIDVSDLANKKSWTAAVPLGFNIGDFHAKEIVLDNSGDVMVLSSNRDRPIWVLRLGRESSIAKFNRLDTNNVPSPTDVPTFSEAGVQFFGVERDQKIATLRKRGVEKSVH